MRSETVHINDSFMPICSRPPSGAAAAAASAEPALLAMCAAPPLPVRPASGASESTRRLDFEGALAASCWQARAEPQMAVARSAGRKRIRDRAGPNGRRGERNCRKMSRP